MHIISSARIFEPQLSELSPRLLVLIFVFPRNRSADMLPVPGQASGTRTASMTITYKTAASSDSSAVSSLVGPIIFEYLKIFDTVPVFPFMQSQLAASTNVDEESLKGWILQMDVAS